MVLEDKETSCSKENEYLWKIKKNIQEANIHKKFRRGECLQTNSLSIYLFCLSLHKIKTLKNIPKESKVMFQIYLHLDNSL